MDQLWAPWRLAYVAAPRKPQTEEPCFICAAVKGPLEQDRAHHVVLRTGASVVLLNRFPYNNGHLLIAPRAHKGALDALSQTELVDGVETVRRMVALLTSLMRPDGFNIGLNLGTAAGAGLPGHLHWHLVPRWQGDTNFMPAAGDVKVISQSLDALYDQLRAALG